MPQIWSEIIIMISSSFLVLAFWAVFGVFAHPGEILKRNASYISSFWNDGTAKAKYTNGPNGEYSVTWTGDIGNFVSGKGWSPGGPR